VQRREHSTEDRQRIGHGSTELAAVQSPIGGAHLDDAVHEAAQRRREGGHAHLPVAGVTNDDHVCREQLFVCVEEALEVQRPDLLFSLDDDLHPDRRGATVGEHRSDVHQDA
jgi:hypothetical protein